MVAITYGRFATSEGNIFMIHKHDSWSRIVYLSSQVSVLFPLNLHLSQHFLSLSYTR